MTKRKTVETFRTRLADVITRSGRSRLAFAEHVGIDRSTLSQILSPDNDRLPRVETLAAIAHAQQVSIDWLVGLSEEGQLGPGVLEQSVQIESNAPSPADVRLARWHAEAAGYKIRYVPTTLPDLFKVDRVIDYEYHLFATIDASQSVDLAQMKLQMQRDSGSDLEVCNSIQAVEGFARGEGIWRDLDVQSRREQVAHMIELADELYPSVRWFLYDSRNRYSAPFTVFGPRRAVLYVGQMYFVFNSADHIRYLTKHFDDLIRAAVMQPPETLALLKRLHKELG
jgi:transcriptional regulator with XRE-family HTH domain